VRLRDTVAADVDFVVGLEADPEAALFIEAWPAERHLAALRDPDVAHLVVVEDGEPVGFVILGGLLDPNGCIEIGRVVIGTPGRGLGRRAFELVLGRAFDDHGAHRVWLDVKADNARARHLYATLGFEEEGTMRDALRTADGYEALVLMAKLAPAQPG
jgi:RimJ/RimL family protein N-acetyltransferase